MAYIEQAEKRAGNTQGEEQELVLVERVSLRATEALRANYPTPLSAMLELVDNAVDNRLRDTAEEKAPVTQVNIKINPQEIRVWNIGCKGLGFDGLGRYLNWGQTGTEEGSIGRFGVGGKAAAATFGRDVTIHCAPRGTTSGYMLFIQNWTGEGEEYERKHKPGRFDAPTDDGYFSIAIQRDPSMKRQLGPEELRRELGDVYRKLIAEGKVIIKVNSKTVEPSQFQYMEDDSHFLPDEFEVESGIKIPDDPEGKLLHIPVKIGVMPPDLKGIEPGIRVNYNGRRILKGQFALFNIPSPHEIRQASRLIGEVDFDLPIKKLEEKLKTTPNKVDFVRDVLFEDTIGRISYFIEQYGWRDRLKDLKMEQKHILDDYEIELLKKSTDILDDIMRRTSLLTRDILPGERHRRLPPTPSENQRPPRKREGKTPDQKGATVPGRDAIVEGPGIKRWGIFHEIRQKALGREDQRADVVDDNGRKILVINIDHPLYQAHKLNGNMSLLIYLTETGGYKAVEETTKDQPAKVFTEKKAILDRVLGEAFREELEVIGKGRRPTSPSKRQGSSSGDIFPRQK